VKEVLEISSFGLYLTVVDGKSKFCKLCQSTGRDWRQLSDKIMSPYSTNTEVGITGLRILIQNALF
jgi:hypothetical protein